MAEDDVVISLKAKLKKANTNHEKMVTEWAQQEENLRKEADDARQALKETFKELQTVRTSLRKLESRGDQAAAASLKSELDAKELLRAQQEEALGSEISSLKDAARVQALAMADAQALVESQSATLAERDTKISDLQEALDTATQLAEENATSHAELTKAYAESEKRAVAAEACADEAATKAEDALKKLAVLESEATAAAEKTAAAVAAQTKAEEELKVMSTALAEQVNTAISNNLCVHELRFVHSANYVSRLVPNDVFLPILISLLTGCRVQDQQAAIRSTCKRPQRAARERSQAARSCRERGECLIFGRR